VICVAWERLDYTVYVLTVTNSAVSLNGDQRFADHSLNRIKHEHGDYVATGGRGMSREVLFRLETFHHKLHSENLVIEYDSLSGFHYRERRDSDRGLII
jgi:hypothetical protein